MSAQPQPRLTPERYLEIERAAEFRSEYYNGHMYAMSGGSLRHGHIIGNLTGLLFQALRNRRCIVSPSDVRLRVSPDGLYTYPDAIVICGEPKFADDQKDTLLNPALVIEVLSPSQAVCRFDSLDCRVALADVYDKVTFGAEEVIPSTRPVS